jgi:alkylation response protein AidB-like acyl-CoA dehydrogenase
MKHKLIRASTRNFAETELSPIAADIDQQRIFPLDVIAKMGGSIISACRFPKHTAARRWIPSVPRLWWKNSPASAQRWGYA